MGSDDELEIGRGPGRRLRCYTEDMFGDRVGLEYRLVYIHIYIHFGE